MDFINGSVKNVQDWSEARVADVKKTTVTRFQKLDWDMDFDKLTTGEFWGCAFKTLLGSAAFVLVAGVNANTAWAWGFSYALVSALISDNLNSLCRWNSFLNGEGKFGCFLYSTIFQVIGAAFAFHFDAAFNLNGASSAVTAMNLFTDFRATWMNSEVVALVLFLILKAKASNNDMPAAVWTILLVAIAFTLGGAGFGFFPAHAYAATGFSSLCSFANLNIIVVQLWAVLVGNFVLDLVWCF